MNANEPSGAPARATPGRRVPRWLWLLLLLSLSGNLFVVGVAARTIWPQRYGNAIGGPGLAVNLMTYANTLPEQRRAVVRSAVAKERPQLTLRPLRQELRAARREAARIFKTEPFSRGNFLEAEARVLAAEAKLRNTIATMSADIAGRMTGDERAEFLKWRELRRADGPRGQAEAEADSAPPKKAAE